MLKTIQKTTYSVARINEIEIVVIENGDKLVPIKPICEIFGIDPKSQRNKIKEDEILNSSGVLSTSVGNDGKEREMFCLPYRYIFGWLFTINPKNVAPEAKEAVLSYKQKCYDILFEHFTDASLFLKQKQELIDQKTIEVKSLRKAFRESNDKLKTAEKQFDEILKLSQKDWTDNGRQVVFPWYELDAKGGAI